MINNSIFSLTDEELSIYNDWLEKISTDMGEAEVESWTASVKFSFSNMGTRIIAHCESDYEGATDLLLRDDIYLT